MQKIKHLYIYILLFTCIYIEFGYAVVVANQLSGTFRSLILLLAVIPLLFFKSRHTNASIILLIYTAIIISLNLVRDNAIGDYFLLFLPIVVGFLIATRIPIDLCISSFVKLIYYLTIYSLLLYSICVISPSVATILPYLGNVYSSSATIHNGLFAVVISGATFARNYGITWEPGAFAVLLCIATYCNLNISKRPNKKYLLVFSLGIITTFSTMGYIVLMCIFISRLNFRKENRAIFAIIIIIAFVALQIPFMRELVFGKLAGIGNTTTELSETTEARMNAIIYPGLAFIKNPIGGVGYEAFKTINTTLCNSVATNTIINWFALFGVLLGAPFLFNYLKTTYSLFTNKSSIFGVILIAIGAISLVSTESLLRISLMYAIIFMGTINLINK